VRIINLYGGPGVGKSTTRARLFGRMKTAGLKVEEATEFAKDLTYDRAWSQLSNQAYVTAGQEIRLDRLKDQVDWCLSDSPLPLGILYTAAGSRFDTDWYRAFIWGLFDTYDNFNVLLTRAKPYQAYGRSQDETQARDLDVQLAKLMAGRIDLVVPADKFAHKVIFDHLMSAATAVASV